VRRGSPELQDSLELQVRQVRQVLLALQGLPERKGLGAQLDLKDRRGPPAELQ
jgi:hypothetical protein